MISGTVTAQAIAFGFTPVLTRLFDVGDFGQFASFNGWVSILALLSCARYEHAIVVASDDETTSRVYALTMVLCLVSTAIYVCGAAAILSSGLTLLPPTQEMVSLVPLGVLLACLNSPLSMLSVRLGGFRRIGAAAIAQVSVGLVAQFAFNAAGIERGLIFGSLVGSIAMGAVLVIPSLKLPIAAQSIRHVRPATLARTAQEFVRFPKYALPADAVGVLILQFSPVVVLALFGAEPAGLFAFAVRVARAPLQVIATAVLNVARNVFSDRIRNNGDLRMAVRRTWLMMLGAGIVPLVLSLLFSEPLFAFVFGEEWRSAGRIMRVLSPGVLMEFVAFPMSAVFLAAGEQRTFMRVQMANLVMLIGALLIGSSVFENFEFATYLVSGAMTSGGVLVIAAATAVSRRASFARN
jgi:O-antigen/teichoic acid export membrane protein